MKKIAIAGAVLAVAVLIGFTGTTTLLGNNSDFLSQALRKSPNGSINSKPGCPDCSGKEQAVKIAQENLNSYADDLVNNVSSYNRIEDVNEKPTLEELKRRIEALKKAKKDLEDCRKLKQAYCAGFDAGRNSK